MVVNGHEPFILKSIVENLNWGEDFISASENDLA